MEAENYRQKGVGEIAEQKVVEAPKERTFQGLQKGQRVKRRIHRGNGIHKYKALTQVVVFHTNTQIESDTRIILIENENIIDDKFLEKFGQFKIIQVRKTCYVAVLESIIEE